MCMNMKLDLFRIVRRRTENRMGNAYFEIQLNLIKSN